ncbi:hypothetical protein O181_025218 [Austropuccinia psidii MF-1]|uniref:Uncharacterized protein n=1 Tax=Austropuccinia psidii MF-1 TaxID=1389203 RepID=A0A9Q3CMA9_9BASI|nr:hypothetical protein [Austropuccinia psidii MF-1]
MHPHCPPDVTPTLPPHHSLRSCSALPTCLRQCPHTGLILNAAYDPYSPAEPSRLDYDSSPHLLLTTPYASAPPPYLL